MIIHRIRDFALVAATAAAIIPAAGIPAAGASAVGTIALAGSIPAQCSISVTPHASAQSLDLTQSATDLAVATVTEACNDARGYRVDLATENGRKTGLLVQGAVNGDEIPYSVSYGGSPVSFSGGSARVTDSSERTPAGGAQKTVAVSYNGDPGLASGSYGDTLTLTLTAN